MFARLTSPKIELLKWIGIISMVSDHVGVLFYPLLLEFRMVGRLAYPLFGYVLIHNYIFYSKNKTNYIKRLLILAVISEPLHYMLFEKYYAWINIFFMYAMTLFSIYIIEESSIFLKKVKFRKILIWIIFILFFALSFFIEYDIRGYLLLLSFYYLFKKIKKYMLVFSFLILALLDAPYPPFILSSLFIYPIIYFVSISKIPVVFRSKVFFYLFYPVHIAILLGFKFNF